MLSALDEVAPNHTVKLADLKSYVSTGFPWHSEEHHNRTEPSEWWKYMEQKFEDDFLSLGIERNRAQQASKLIRRGILRSEAYFVFPEVPMVLTRLAAKGWSHVILSNNHPDLEQVLDSIQLLRYFKYVVTSAYVGCEKPDPKIFSYAIKLAAAKDHKKWMVGDNPKYDIEGADRVGIPSILVRHSGNHLFKAQDLYEVAAIIERSD